MYNMPRDVRPTKPFITTQRHAHAEFARWLRENNLDRLEDNDGLIWDLRIVVKEMPSQHDLRGGEWHVRFYVSREVTAEEFVRTNTLHADNDRRLLAMIADQVVTLAMRPRHVIAPSLEQARTAIMDQVERMRQEMKTTELNPMKRKLIGDYINKSLAFGNSWNSSRMSPAKPS